MSKSDPIGVEYYKPLQIAEKSGDILFYLAAILSVATLVVEKDKSLELNNLVQALFAVSVLLLFLIGLAVRLHWSTRAQTKRMSDLMSHAFELPLIPETSKEYYNNVESEPLKRLAASLLENTLFSKEILQKMLTWERVMSITYGTIWLLLALNRKADLSIVSAAAQVVFSEQILSKWVRMEWLRARVERIYDDTYSLIQSSNAGWSKEYRARVIEYLLRYETGKAQAGISLSSSVFKKMNPALSKRWADTANTLGIHV
ncbi:hypothetical protein [Methylocystis iwaonis]|uniref:Uncharacterized protein n=1 Tax=Methylocystis iwaonis TaxID=2885079 RepID=A0ABN6VQ51_9HYPH|nr:hypothetical protein [Methylocystis iwaonis]BDV36586.1 hypothetical protein SS37A_41160 [Methylocystis iwaonis]